MWKVGHMTEWPSWIFLTCPVEMPVLATLKACGPSKSTQKCAPTSLQQSWVVMWFSKMAAIKSVGVASGWCSAWKSGWTLVSSVDHGGIVFFHLVWRVNFCLYKFYSVVCSIARSTLNQNLATSAQDRQARGEPQEACVPAFVPRCSPLLFGINISLPVLLVQLSSADISREGMWAVNIGPLCCNPWINET